MARTSNPLIGKSSGSMGGATFSSWKGINVLKNKPTSVANPKTPAQLAQRMALAMIVAAFRAFPGAINAGFKKAAVQMSAFNAFASYALKNAFTFGTPGIATLVPASIYVSTGTMATTAMLTHVGDRSDNTITATWAHTSLAAGQSLTDKAIIGAYNATKDEWTGASTSALRSADTASVPLPASWATGDSVTIYLGFYSPATGDASNSVNATANIQA